MRRRRAVAGAPPRLARAFLGLAALLLAAPASAETSELRIGVQFGIGYLPIYVARDAGLIDKHLRAAGLPSVPIQILHVAGAPQINDGLLSRTMEIGSGGLTALIVAWEKTRGGGDNEIKGATALSSVPYVLLTIDPKVQSLKDLSSSNKIGMTAIKVSVPAILLEMAAEKTFGAGQHAKLN